MTPYCKDDAICGAGNKCQNTAQWDASCTSCAAGDKNCRCPSGQEADGSGKCKASVSTCSQIKGTYALSTGAYVDSANCDKGGPNGVTAEKICKDAGKRLPTLAELREMYNSRSAIGNFTNTYDGGGWPYWSQRVSGDYGYRKLFASGGFGSQGEEQYKTFAKGSGVGAYIRCVSNGYVLSTGAVVDSKNSGSGGPNGVTAEKTCSDAGKRLPTLAELREMYNNRSAIGNFTNTYDGGGWPYWSQRVSGDYGYRKLFASGGFGSQGEEQYKTFAKGSGVGAYIRCVSK